MGQDDEAGGVIDLPRQDEFLRIAAGERPRRLVDALEANIPCRESGAGFDAQPAGMQLLFYAVTAVAIALGMRIWGGVSTSRRAMTRTTA